METVTGKVQVAWVPMATIKPLELSKRDLFERYSRAADLWSQVVLSLAGGPRQETLAAAIELGTMALSLVPDQPEGANLVRALEAQVQQRGSWR